VPQITSGVRRVLSIPLVYDTLQRLVGVRKCRTILVNQHIRPTSGHRILDIGCGTGTLLSFLPQGVEYIGFDASAKYIATAKKTYGDRGTFVNKLLSEADIDQYRGFDRVIATGLLHHLDDEEVTSLCRLARLALKPASDAGPGGEFHSLDCCYVEGQSRVSKFLIDRDRGQNVRTIEHFRTLAASVFDTVETTHRTDMQTVPYDIILMRCHQGHPDAPASRGRS